MASLILKQATERLSKGKRQKLHLFGVVTATHEQRDLNWLNLDTEVLAEKPTKRQPKHGTGEWTMGGSVSLIDGHIDENRCVCCGEIIPEGSAERE